MKNQQVPATMRDEIGYKGLEDLIKKIDLYDCPCNMTMIEIGSYTGESTVVFAKHFKKVITIDPFLNNYDTEDPTCRTENMGLVEETFLNTIRKYTNIEHLKMLSNDAIDILTIVDFVYIDGNHAYRQVIQDIINYFPLVSANGFIGGHDYTEEYKHIHVKKAVDLLLGIPSLVFADTSWLFKKSEVVSNLAR